MSLRIMFVLLGIYQLVPGAERAPLTSLAEVRSLSREEAQKNLPVEIEGTVIFFENRPTNLDEAEGMVLHDGETGCWVGLPLPSPFRAKFRPGARVRIAGETHGRSYFPDVKNASIEFLRQGSMPKPRPITSAELFASHLDSQWVEIEGVVVGREPRGVGITLVVEVEGHTLKAGVALEPDADQRAGELIQQRVRIQGVLGTVLNAKSQMTGRHFLIPSFDHIVPVLGGSKPARIKQRTISQLLTNSHEIDEAVRVSGVITQTHLRGFYLNDETGSSFVNIDEAGSYQPGSEVLVTGYAKVAPFRPEMRATEIELLGKKDLPPATAFNPEKDHRIPVVGKRVIVDAKYLSRAEGLEETLLQCQSGQTFFEARLPGPNLFAKDLNTGDHVRLTGTYEMTTSHPLPRVTWADGFQLILSSDEDIELLNRAPWWTLERVLLALAGAAAILVAVIIWNWLLRRKVAAQAATITQQVEQGILKDERHRIARELHDTVEQELTGVSMQLGNLSSVIDENDEIAMKPLKMARRMLKHCREETRASIGDLRDPQLLDRTLPEAIQEALSDLDEDECHEINFSTGGSLRPLQATTEQHLLRMGREAVLNAIKHATATQIQVRLCYADDALKLDISDNGEGFDTSKKTPKGHFGIIGMRERANKIHADLSLHSSPDNGTTVRIRMPWTSPAAIPEYSS